LTVPATAAMQKTLVFCTAYVPSPEIAGTYVPSLEHGTAYLESADGDDKFYSWDLRYRIWLDAILTSGLNFDQILIVDDGSPTLPQWKGVTIRQETDDIHCEDKIVLHHFAQNLGRHAVSDFPGWVRSFLFAARYARENGFTRVIHLESDAFLISARLQAYANAVQDGWISLFCPRHNRPESGIQFIAGSGLQNFFALADAHHDTFQNIEIESSLPFTHVERQFVGDRYGEDSFYVPRGADWSMQTRPNGVLSLPVFYWWLKDVPAVTTHADLLDYGFAPERIVDPEQDLGHPGLFYLEALSWMDTLLAPRTYLEIGTSGGHSVELMSGDTVCVDPSFQINHNVLGRRRRSFFYQGTSDEFFQEENLRLHFPQGIDLAFLDGLHMFETLLRDFIHVERFSTARTVVLLHDCLPFNTRMAERLRRNGGEDEEPAIRDFWTGDVWKVLLILKRYRPDLSVCFLDSGPTGLVVCTGLKAHSPILTEQYDRIVADFAEGQLTKAGLFELRHLFPTFNSRQIVNSSGTMKRAFRLD
jgi:hypothetical protein